MKNEAPLIVSYEEPFDEEAFSAIMRGHWNAHEGTILRRAILLGRSVKEQNLVFDLVLEDQRGFIFTVHMSFTPEFAHNCEELGRKMLGYALSGQ